MSFLTAWSKNWAPIDHRGEAPEDHMRRMYSVGTIGSQLLYFNPVITGLAAGGIWGFVIWAIIQKEEAAEDSQEAQAWITDVWNWLYMSSQNIWILVLVYLLYRYGSLKFGNDEDEPEFSDTTYFAMLFSCGVSTGLWYYTAEGMWHYEGYGTPRWMDSQMFNENTRAEHSLMILFFHWGLHGWIPYTTVGALIAIMSYRRGFPMSMRFTLYPLIGEMCYGVLGDMVEVMSILCTVFGVCTSLGLGAMQINKGLVRLDRGTYRGKDTIGCETADQITCAGRTGMEMEPDNQIIIIVFITLLATISVILGMHRGIKALANIAFALSLFILLTVLFMDNTWYILNALTSAFGYYLWYLPKISFHTDAWEELGTDQHGLGGADDNRGGAAGWMNSWTIFYWGWWISWGPFVGTFLARISKGRRLGSFIMATLILPSLWSFVFMGIFGAAQIRITNQAITAGLDGSDISHVYGSMANKSAVGWNVPNEDGTGATWQGVPDGVVRLYSLGTEDVLFEHLQYYGGPGYGLFISIVTMICIVLYFVTSSDSASYVVDIMAANGSVHPPVLQKIFWAFTEGAAAISLLAAAGDENPKAALNAVKALPIILGLPFTFLLFWMCQSLVIVCQEESGDLDPTRKNFTTFLINSEPASFLAVLCPFIPLGQVAAKTWGGQRTLWFTCYGTGWAILILFLVLGVVADGAFGYMAASMYFILVIATAGLRGSVRMQLGISGDMISDACATCLAFPFVIGQMAVEDFEAKAQVKEAKDPCPAPLETLADFAIASEQALEGVACGGDPPSASKSKEAPHRSNGVSTAAAEAGCPAEDFEPPRQAATCASGHRSAPPPLLAAAEEAAEDTAAVDSHGNGHSFRLSRKDTPTTPVFNLGAACLKPCVPVRGGGGGGRPTQTE